MIGVSIKEIRKPIKNIGQYCRYFSYTPPITISGRYPNRFFRYDVVVEKSILEEFY